MWRVNGGGSLWLAAIAASANSIGLCVAQLQAGVYDFGQGRYGEKRGSFTPGEWLAGILLLMTIVLGLALSFGLCYYVNKRQRRELTKRSPSTSYVRQENSEAGQERIYAAHKLDNRLPAAPVVVGPGPPPRVARSEFDRGSISGRQERMRTPNDSLIAQI